MMKPILKVFREGMTLVLMVIFAPTYAQIGINTTSPHPSAALDIVSDTSGLLMPRLSTAARDNINGAANGLLVFDTDFQLVFCYFNSAWYPLNAIRSRLTPSGTTTDTVSFVHGKVGIGVETPTERLHVNGNIKTSGNVNVGGNVNAAKLYGEGAVPAGTIVMWSGNPNTLPQGWALCDGSAGRPDLRGRFVVGYDNKPVPDIDYNQVGKVGPQFTDADGFSSGANAVDAKQIRLMASQSGLPAHTHSVSDLGHQHQFSEESHFGMTKTVGANGGGGEQAVDPWRGNMVPRDTQPEFTGITINTSTALNAAIPIENRPPYYVLAYIIKLPY